MSKFNNLIIDGSNLFWRASSVTIKKQLDSKEDIFYPYAIIDSFKRIKELVNQFGYETSKVFLLFDNPTSAFNLRRIVSNGQYKHNREKGPEALWHTLSIFQEIASVYSDNFYIVKADDLEADDLTIILKKELEGPSLFISADLDWARNIDEEDHWFNWNSVYTSKLFKDKHGYSPLGDKIQIYKAIHGDNSDCINNVVPNIPKKLLANLVNKFNNINELFKYAKENQNEKWLKKIVEAENDIRNNYILVDFVDINLSYNSIVKQGKENIRSLRKLYELLGLTLEPRMLFKTDSFITRKKMPRINKR